MRHSQRSKVRIGTFDGRAGSGIRRDTLPVSDCRVGVELVEKSGSDDGMKWIEITGTLPQKVIRVSVELPPGAMAELYNEYFEG